MQINSKRAQDKVAMVTGGASGIGEAIARRLVEEGAKVVITDIQVTLGQQLANELGCDFFEQDVTDETRWESVISEIEQKHDSLHILINNAGIDGQFEQSDPENTSLTDWQTIQRINVEGVFLGCKTSIPALRRSGGGSIVNLSSIAALKAMPMFTAYGASKSAVRHLTKSVALHCASNGSNIRCNSVHPGPILTPMVERTIDNIARARNISREEVLEEWKSPQGDFVVPEDIASAVMFLVSEESKHITGIKLVVDGGKLLDGW